ncbi:MAG: hypothetical protein NT126_00795 [Bacteroidetes bacterium]|nr:hypothetical protein [Bacteroidota bacterium]
MNRYFFFCFLFITSFQARAVEGFEYEGYLFSMTAYDDKAGGLSISSPSGDPLFSLREYFCQSIEAGKKDTLTSDLKTFKIISSGHVKNGVRLIFKYTSAVADVVVSCNLGGDSSEINFSLETRYKKNVTVIREALLFNFEIPVAEVYRKNRAVDDHDFQDEYWLDKEGVRFGSGKKNILVYHVPGISSLQLNTPAKELIINLDYYRDHPFLHFPLLEGKVNQKEDLSCSVYKSGETKKNSFSVFAGREIKTIPRLMLNPDGYLSAYVFTEHADWSDIRTHRAVYFGSEDVTNAEQATGGFVKNKIPVTKSVFYANPDHVLNSESRHRDIFTTPIASIKETEGFLDFLKQLNERGYDICLHTPDQNTAGRPLLEEAISFMKKNFNTVSWIDHGYDNGAKNNREAFVCDGLIPSSPSYAKDYWEKYGTRYFWNSYHEDFTTADSLLLFNASQEIPYSGFGDAVPTPCYWLHQTRTGNFYSWCTKDLLEMPDVNLWNYFFSNERLKDFAHNRAVKFNHCYPAGGVENKGFWKMNEQKKIVVEPEFEKMLERLAAYRDSGLINVSTVRDLLNYWISCEKIKFDYSVNGKIIIENQNDHDVKGLSLVVKASHVMIDGITPASKKDGSDLIFWFDMKAGQRSEIRFSE